MINKLLRLISASLLSLSLIAGQVLPVAAPVALLGGVVITQTACPGDSKSISEVANEIGLGFEDAIRVFSANNLPTAKLVRGKDLAFEVRDAFAGGDPANGLELTRRLIALFEDEILAEIGKIENSTARTIALVALLVVNRALQKLADKMEDTPAAVQSQARTRAPGAVGTIEKFKKKKAWQCRNSITGKYAPMSYCEKFPATSTVETR